MLAEFRIAPLLFEAHGLAGEAAVEALLAGLARSALPSGLIVCAMRHLPASETLRAAHLALRYQGRDAGLPLTLHAGEADAAERVVEAVRLGARRIGHGVRLVDALTDPARRALIDAVIGSDVHLEVCPTSNVHTGAAASLAAHPIAALWRAGLSLSFHTDNRLMSRITHSSEAAALLQQTALTATDLVRMGLEAARHSFLAPAIQEAARRHLQRWAARAALQLPSAPLSLPPGAP